jgi:hypothetical protein
LKFVDDDNGNNNHHHRYLENLSLVSKRFLSITNNLRFSFTFPRDPTHIPLTSLFHRFTNLTFCHQSHLNNLLRQISHFPIHLKSLNLSNKSTIPANELRLLFTQNITTSLHATDLLLIADCFPFLEELDLSGPQELNNINNTNFLNALETLLSALFKLRKVNLTRHYYINDQLLFHLFKNCQHLEEVIIVGCHRITNDGMVSALRQRPTLRSLSFTNFFNFDNCAKLFALLRNCPSLSTIKMVTYSGRENTGDNSNSLIDFVVSPQIMSLQLPIGSWLTDESIKIFASIFPNLQLLDLSHCHNISEQGIFQVLKRCSNIRHLNLTYCRRVKLGGMNFEVPKLEVLNLSDSSVDDESLNVISKSCRGLLQLVLNGCCHVTEKGVNHVLQNCTQLRELNLGHCRQVRAKFVSSMVFLRPSLRMIIAPPHCRFSETKRKLFANHGCRVC